MLSHVIFVIIQVLQKSKVNFCLRNQMRSLHLPTKNASRVAFLLKSLDIKKASELDKFLSKLVKATSDILSVAL